MKKQKFLLWGAWTPNVTPESHDSRNLSRARRGAQDPEKISEIVQAVVEKIEFEKNSFRFPNSTSGLQIQFCWTQFSHTKHVWPSMCDTAATRARKWQNGASRRL